MALKKTLTVDGFTGEYWVITKLSWNKFENKTSCVISCYKDEVSRRNNINAVVHTKEFVFDGEIPLSLMYEKLKFEGNPTQITGSFFKDAVNV